MKVPAKYTEKFNQVVAENPNAYSVEYVDYPTHTSTTDAMLWGKFYGD